MATIPRTVVVRGPRVRYSLRTSVVAAGAVAEQIAPSTRPSASEVFAFFVKINATAVTRIPTTKKGVTDSPIRMPINCLPYFLRTLSLSSAPIKKPISESAIVLTGLSAIIVSRRRIWNPEEPIMIPITI